MNQDGSGYQSPRPVVPQSSAEYQPPAWDSWSDSPETFPDPTDQTATWTPPFATGEGDGEPLAHSGRTPPPGPDEDLEPTEALAVGSLASPSQPQPDHGPLGGPGRGSGTSGALTAPTDPASTGDQFYDQEVPELGTGTVISGRYRLEEPKARRGRTSSWRAFDQKLSRPVMVHLLNLGFDRNEEVLAAARQAAIATDSRFLRVLDAVGPEGVSLSGPDTEDATLGAYIVSEFVPGQNMEQLLASGPLSGLEAAWIARELADALAPMHAQGLFHEQLGPSTVVVTATGNIKIVGFLIEEAMHPTTDAPPMGDEWTGRQEADLRAIGQLLYACLVNRWPAPQAQAGRQHWGMPPAPMDDRGWLTPRQVRAGVSPALDLVCDQVLSEAPRAGGVPITTVAELNTALSRVLGSADASADLEHRVRYPTTSPQTSDPLPLGPQSSAPVGPAPTGAAPTGATATVTAAAHPSPRVLAPGPATVVPPPSHHQTGSPSSGPAESDRRPPPRYWLMVLVGLVLVTLVASLIAVAVNSAGTSGAEDPPSTSTSAGGEPIRHPFAAVKDFDPAADGGNDEERPQDVAKAWDKNPTTAWVTLRYLNNPKLGGLKPGVGLVVDLGQPVEVGRVVVTLQGQPTAVQVLVPARDPEGATAPMDTIKSWRRVAANDRAGTTATLTPQSAVRTRHVLVYLTSLPKVDANGYRGAIAEIEVYHR